MSEVLLVTGLVAGGVGTHVADVARGVRASGWQVSVAAPAAVLARFGLDGDGTAVYPVRVGSRPSPIADALAIATLRQRMGHVEVVHAHGLRAGALAVLARASMRPVGRRRRPRSHTPALVVTSHNAPPTGTASRGVYRVLERIVLSGADDLLVVSPDLHPSRPRRHTMPAAMAVVAAGRRELTTGAATVRAELRLPPGSALLLSVGRLAPQKALHRFVDVVAILHALGYAVSGLIVGEGPEREHLQRLIDSSGAAVRLVGHRDDVPELLAAADIVVSTAHWEGQPVWLQEALAVGSAVVATDVGGTKHLLGEAALWVDDHPAGTATSSAPAVTDLVEHAVSQRIAQQVMVLLDDPTALERLRHQARARAEHLPTSQDATQAVLASYRRAAAYHRRPHVD
ncbi:MAG: glycosyltransferase [Ornithinimicrobium sp.]